MGTVAEQLRDDRNDRDLEFKMSRQIDIGYRFEDGTRTSIEVHAPYYLFGTQSTSKEFWSLPRLLEIGITGLTELGVTDPVYFVGWGMSAELGREIDLLREHLASIEFHAEIKASWLAHLTYCHALLTLTAPSDSTPMLAIG